MAKNKLPPIGADVMLIWPIPREVVEIGFADAKTGSIGRVLSHHGRGRVWLAYVKFPEGKVLLPGDVIVDMEIVNARPPMVGKWEWNPGLYEV